MKIQKVELDKIYQNENSRVIYKTIDTAELMLSLKKDGLLQPVGLAPLKGGKYDAIWGNRRILAAKKLGWTHIDAHIVEVDGDMERDIIGLIENMKRQNTTPAEDGRIFQSLIDRGLSVPEISVRLDISEQRIKTALEVLNVVPEEYRSKIVYKSPGLTKKVDRRRNTIPATTAVALLNSKRNLGLNREQTRSLFNFAAEKSPSIPQLQKLAPMVKEGMSVAQAFESIMDYETVVVKFFMRSSNIEKLENKHKKKVGEIIYDFVSKNNEFKVEQIKNNKFSLRKRTKDLDKSISEL